MRGGDRIVAITMRGRGDVVEEAGGAPSALPGRRAEARKTNAFERSVTAISVAEDGTAFVSTVSGPSTNVKAKV